MEHNLLRASSLLHSVLHKKQDSKTIEKEKPTQKTSKVLTQIDKQPTTQQVDDDDDEYTLKLLV